MTIKMTGGACKFVCVCDKTFATQFDLSQHRRDSPSHRKPSESVIIRTSAKSPALPAKDGPQKRKVVYSCNQKFTTAEALAQHRRDSPLHRRSFTCDCKKTFPTIEALVQHQKGHQKAIVCDCNKTFATKEDLAQHQQTADIHRQKLQKFSCICGRAFVSFADLAQHLRDSPRHGSPQVKDTKKMPSKTHNGSQLTPELSLLNVLLGAIKKEL
ncbi:hypothetical protein GGR57DRAFT_467303 [Xylariaceae sp. FL1272]|nr:hypothetical protein GGR57DRAFT_467303 [Xylariaceae sp. FL1272]